MLFCVPVAKAEQLVRVGAYHFPPYIVKPESSKPKGLLPELLGTLNEAQQHYRFKLVPTSVTRRYRDFTEGRYDLIFFESPDWGWQGIELDMLDLRISDAEVYVARAVPGRDQSYFASLRNKRMALYNGYHYGFAGFNADQNFLSNNFNAVLTYSHDSNLLMLLHDRADISVVTRSYLRLYQREHPQLGAQLLVSTRTDQVYRHHALLRPGAVIDSDGLERLLQELKGSGRLGELLTRYYLLDASQVQAEPADPMPR
ncbi:amino acid ABC transporter substrate-binding protein [Pseudomonas sp. CAU 1711]|uniref:substrate-binding periplasmic protein n=1 Tax=Pseudomonas sp. CAU 1711 TaxID=3140356 RepID=UPI003260ACF2